MKKRKFDKILIGDFETTVFDGQEFTEVWASGIVEMGKEDCKIFTSIDDTFKYLISLRKNCVLYFHNLKFDGSYWVDFLINKAQYKQAINNLGCGELDIEWLKESLMPDKSFKYSISQMGTWYTIVIKTPYGKIIEIRDSLKLLPFSLKKIGKDFKTKHQKLEMEYTGFRYAGCEITKEEREYLKNDLLVLSEALSIMYAQGYNKLTIGACCLAEYKAIIGEDNYNILHPNVYSIPIDNDTFEVPNAGFYLRKTYKGAWCYVVPEKANKIHKKGITADVNSLYPSVMHSESGNKYPVGLPTFWSGNHIPEEALAPNKYFFIRIRCEFYLKKDKLPFIQIKGNPLYKPTQMLITSDVLDCDTGLYSNKIRLENGNVISTTVTLSLTMTDFYLIQEHYNLVNLKILDGCYFNAVSGLFDKYIDKHKKIKIENEGAISTIAKLFLNNLYGKMATNDNSSFKYALADEEGLIHFYDIVEFQKTPGYIPIGSAITSYARNFTIRHAQMNYYGPDKPGFIYADTDSIHCDLDESELKGINIHPSNFLHWKLEANWNLGLFVRQKTYIERVIKENGKELDNPFYNIKCAGMPQKCKDMFILSVEGGEYDKEKYSEEEIEFISKKRRIKDFKVGLKIPGKLLPRRIRGGIVLYNTTYEMR